ncbi:hypothetical protein [Azorhizophilus paspali]|uniref:Plasmid stabilization protein n=1 Tax=Azorhizophilus paspali TaxID=69963 RepID=A0ABV6SH25_AZOPA
MRSQDPGEVDADQGLKAGNHVKLGSLLSEIGRKANLTEEESAIFESARDRTPARAVSFE